MLTVKLLEQEAKLTLSLNGHAGAGKWGEDIVCAAASILAYTAAASARQLYREEKLTQRPHIQLEPGNARIVVETCEAACQMLDVVCMGFGLLAVRYPKNVHFIRE